MSKFSNDMSLNIAYKKKKRIAKHNPFIFLNFTHLLCCNG